MGIPSFQRLTASAVTPSTTKAETAAIAKSARSGRNDTIRLVLVEVVEDEVEVGMLSLHVTRAPVGKA